MEHELWNLNVKEFNIVSYTQRFNELALMCPRKVESENVKVDAYIRGLFENNKCHKCGKVGHKSRYCNEKAAATDINPDKLDVSYEVELADGKVVSTNTMLRGCTLNLVNHLFKIDLMPIEHGTFDVIIGIDWLAEHDVFIICGKRMFVAYVTDKKPKEKRMEDVPVIHDFPEGCTCCTCTISSGTVRDERTIGTTARAVGGRIYSPEFIAVGNSGIVCKEEGWILSDVY
ncbi:putative reverse transcriptase domain-containing protein [Tanacetum coccineum]|uniref:Reverse transcriptase domain-containing protein n=1 Tax=Tanacetum coccineum TaxID=301880 RepID=A0ABQ5FI76_9ASTR